MIRPLALLVLTCLAVHGLASQGLTIDIQKSTPISNATSNLRVITSQLDAINLPLVQAGDRLLYWINITVGTPGQPQSLQIDTGSRRAWIPAKGSPICSGSLVDCRNLGAFDSSASSTYNDASSTDTIAYADGTSVTGEVFSEVFHVGGQPIRNQIGLLGRTGSGVYEGVLGVGFPASAPTINHNMAAQGLISSNRYSIYLNKLDASRGTIIFGGVDFTKFVAPLLRVPVTGTDQPTVALTRLATLDGVLPTVQTGPSFSEPVILDTGTALTVLPTSLVNSINNAMGSQYYPEASDGVTIIPCSAKSKNKSINFHSGGLLGPTINVDMSELVLQELGTLDEVDMCQFGVYASDGSFPTTLGDTFLRSAYVLNDVDRRKIGLAQAIV